MSKFFVVCFFLLGCQRLFASESLPQNSVVKQINELQIKSRELSPDLKIVRNNRSQKVAETYTKSSHFLPQAYLKFKRSKDFYDERNAPLRALGIQTYDSSWGIDYSWNLLNYGLIQSARKSFTEKDKADLELSITEASYPIAYNTNLLNYLLAKYKKAAIENSLLKADAKKREAKIGFEIGQKTKLDVLRSEANTVSLEAKKTSFIEEEQNTKSQFLEYSGLGENDLIFLENQNEEQVLTLISLISESYSVKDNPDFSKSPLMTNLNYEEKINKFTLNSLTQNQWPDLRIEGSYNNSGETFENSFHRPYRTHAIALVLTIPLFNGGSLVSSSFEEFYANKQNEYTLGKRKLETKNQLINTLVKINALETLVASLTLNVSQFEELYRLTEKSYQLGKSTLIELLQVQDSLLDSKISLAQNKIQFYTLSQNYLWQAGLQ